MINLRVVFLFVTIVFVQCDEQAQCYEKGMPLPIAIYVTLKLAKLFLNLLSGEICGDKCTRKYCKCGEENEIDYNDGLYCCNHPNETCEKENDVICENGELLPWTSFCKRQHQCPVRVVNSETAILVNCSLTKNHHCPENRRISKLCSIDPNTSIEKYCFMGKESCPQNGHGPGIEQCYYR